MGASDYYLEAGIGSSAEQPCQSLTADPAVEDLVHLVDLSGRRSASQYLNRSSHVIQNFQKQSAHLGQTVQDGSLAERLDASWTTGRRWSLAVHSSSEGHSSLTGPACLGDPQGQQRQGTRPDVRQESLAETLLGLEGPVMDHRKLEGSRELMRSRLNIIAASIG